MTVTAPAADESALHGPTSMTRELSFDIWDWTHPAQDLTTFNTWVEDLKKLGFHRVELSVPWKLLEPAPGQIDLSWLRQRHAICQKHRIGMRLRINSFHSLATPEWYKGDVWRDASLQPVPQSIPSINDDLFWKHYGPLCAAIAKELRGQNVHYNAFIGVHAELKYANWWTFDEASLELWRKSIQRPRPPWLSRVVGNVADLPTTPSVPTATSGKPEISHASLAFIAFREWTWRRAMERFVAAIREGDPAAHLSSPLGESYRRESAIMSNLDYWGLTRGSSDVVHSYDFFIHNGATPLWHVAATIASFQGITGLPVSFEFDSPETITGTGYDEYVQKAVAQTAYCAGAGLKFANFSYGTKLPSAWPVIEFASECAQSRWSEAAAAPRAETVLLYFSKWANYSYRESTEWLHDAQFGWWKLLSDLGVPSRIICEDNLDEDLSGYRAMILAFSPLDLLPAEDRAAVERLKIVQIADYVKTPDKAPRRPVKIELPPGKHSHSTPADQLSSRTVLERPLGYHYLHSEDRAKIRSFAGELLK